MLTRRQQFVKRTFDVTLAFAGLIAAGWLIALCSLAIRAATGDGGIFRQQRIGLGGRPFTIYKLRTMRRRASPGTCVTTSADPRITPLGRWLRRTKLDELPQLWNVFVGDMSFVGPRPDVLEMLPLMHQHAPQLLTVRPGITSPASLKYRHEETLLARQADPEAYNAAVIFPDKLRINARYFAAYRFRNDLACIWRTLVGGAVAEYDDVAESGAPPNHEILRIAMSTPAANDSPWPAFDEEMIEATVRALRSGRVNYWTGDEGRHFEAEYAAHVGCEHAIAVANGTLALELALFALDVGPGDEVIVPSRTFIATASCAVARGARPVCADVDRESQNLTVATAAPLVTPRTKAIIAVHLAGWPCDVPALVEFARPRGIAVVEDCAQAHGAEWLGRPVGSLGDIGCFSFCQDKILTTAGEGGMLVTSREDLWRRAWQYKDHGKQLEAFYAPQPPSTQFRWLHDTFGSNFRLSEVQSAVGRIMLRRLPEWRAARTKHAEELHAACASLPALRTPRPAAGLRHAYYKFYTFVRPERLAAGWSRDRIVATLRERNVACFSGSCSEIYREAAFPAEWRPATQHAIAKELGETSLMFLIHPTLTEATRNRTLAALRETVVEATAPAGETHDRAAA